MAEAHARKKSLIAWIVFVATLLVLSFAAMPNFDRYSIFADRALIAIRLSLVLALSILVLQEKFSAACGADRGGSLLQRMRRWYYDD